MSYHEFPGASDEWYTPAYIFSALDCHFDLDVASPSTKTFVPAADSITQDSLTQPWSGFIWMNPPFGGRNGLFPWIEKFIQHGNGIALTPDRTSAPWWQHFARHSDGVLFVSPKIKFFKPDGTTGNSPSTGTSLFAIGTQGIDALQHADTVIGTFFARSR